jgi:hypothetical protein
MLSSGKPLATSDQTASSRIRYGFGFPEVGFGNTPTFAKAFGHSRPSDQAVRARSCHSFDDLRVWPAGLFDGFEDFFGRHVVLPFGPGPGVERLRSGQHLIETRGWGYVFSRRLFFRPHIFDAIDRPASAAPANTHEERAIRSDTRIGRGEAVDACRFEEDLLIGFVTAAIGLERKEVNLAERPVEREDAAVIVLGELDMPVTDNSGRRTSTDGPKYVDHVRIIISLGQALHMSR